MRALTLHQPWASLVALGAKTIETRSWHTDYRGPLAIHAGKRIQPGWSRWMHLDKDAEKLDVLERVGVPCDEDEHGSASVRPWFGRLPRGAVVATCELVDCVPIDRGAVGHHVGDFPHDGPLAHQEGGLWLIGPGAPNNGAPTRIEDQRAFGDFTPGRWAWLLTDIVRVDPVPARGRQGLWEWTP